MNWLKSLFSRRRLFNEVSEQVREHLDEKIAALMDDGMTRDQAEQAARREFGNVSLIEERSREVWQWPTIESISADLKLTAFQLRKAPLFTASVVATLALGIGANTAIFSVIDTVLLKPLSYPDSGRIVQFLLKPPQGGAIPSSSIADFRLWREQTRAFRDVSAYDFASNGLSLTGDVPEEVRSVHVTADYFRLLGASMLFGRAFTPQETGPNGGSVVVLSHGLWQSRFNADPHIVGTTISLDHEIYTIVGVTGQNFQSDPAADLWIPFQFALESNDPTHYLRVVGRLQPGVTLTQANAELALAAQAARHMPSFADSNFGFEVKPLRDVIVSDAQSSLLLLGVAVGLVLLIACANVANLLLVRASSRKREFAIRSALGAGRLRILRQLLTESLVLSLIGGVLGAALGLTGVRALLSVGPGNIPRIAEGGAFVPLDGRIFVFTLGLSLLTGILFGLFPALTASRLDLNSALKESGNPQGSGFRQYGARSVFVVSQTSLAVVLLIGAALLIRTFLALHAVDLGFDPHNVIRIDMPLAGKRFATTAGVSAFVKNAHLRINAIPGVQNSAMTSSPPFTSRLGVPFAVVGRSLGNASSSGDALWLEASPGYLDVFQIPLLRGRDFTDADSEASPPVVLINEAMAERFWPNQNPLGRQIVLGVGLGRQFQDLPRQVIGIVGNTRDVDLSSPPEPAIIVPQAQVPNHMTAFWSAFGPAYWLVRTRVDPHSIAPLVAQQLSAASGGLAVGHIRSMNEVMSASISRQHFNMLLLTLFAASALLLATVGIYGVVSCSIAQRSREIGVRMALGAGRAGIRNLVLRQGMLLAFLGAVLGVCAAFGLVRFIASFLFDVIPWDPIVFVSVPLLLLSTAFFAVWLPARRATHIDPVQALRSE
jgi:putative ABC transport system permease protein